MFKPSYVVNRAPVKGVTIVAQDNYRSVTYIKKLSKSQYYIDASHPIYPTLRDAIYASIH